MQEEESENDYYAAQAYEVTTTQNAIHVLTITDMNAVYVDELQILCAAGNMAVVIEDGKITGAVQKED